MKALHRSRNLQIDFDEETLRYLITVCFHEESIRGEADGRCPRCQGPTSLALWEFEGPGGESNTLWLNCVGDCKVSNRERFRWARPVSFEGDWSDV